MTDKEAMKLALEALELVKWTNNLQVDEAIAALKERLAQPEKEPCGSQLWVGLTQKEVQDIHDTFFKRMGPQEFAQAIEAKLRSKNNE